MYCEFCIFKQKRACGKTDFIAKLSEIQINFYKRNGLNTYKVPLKQLKIIAKNDNWITEFDEYTENVEITNFTIDNDEVDNLKKENEDLKKQLLEMKQQLESLILSKPKKIKKNKMTEEELLEIEFSNQTK